MGGAAVSRSQLTEWVVDFTEAFNRENIDEVMAYFAEDAIYDEFFGLRHRGKTAIREAFVPQFQGKFGKMRFHTEDMFLDPEAGKAMISWTLTLEEPGRGGGWRGLDLLYFRDGLLAEKHTYCKAKMPLIEKAEESPRIRKLLGMG